jgi:hypothetical protein
MAIPRHDRPHRFAGEAAQQPAPITVVEVESTLKPSPITLTVGWTVDLNVQNVGKADHNRSRTYRCRTSSTFVPTTIRPTSRATRRTMCSISTQIRTHLAGHVHADDNRYV